MVSEHLKKLIECLNTVNIDNMECGRAGIDFDCLAELALEGKDIHTILPDVATHIDCCHDCREEYEALVALLVAERENRLS
jgi:hypothetical protein